MKRCSTQRNEAARTCLIKHHVDSTLDHKQLDAVWRGVKQLDWFRLVMKYGGVEVSHVGFKTELEERQFQTIFQSKTQLAWYETGLTELACSFSSVLMAYRRHRGWRMADDRWLMPLSNCAEELLNYRHLIIKIHTTEANPTAYQNLVVRGLELANELRHWCQKNIGSSQDTQ